MLLGGLKISSTMMQISIEIPQKFISRTIIAYHILPTIGLASARINMAKRRYVPCLCNTFHKAEDQCVMYTK